MLDFIEQLEASLGQPLGMKAQYHMAPSYRSRPKREWIHAQNPRPAAVMLFLYPKNEQLHMVFTKRHDYQGVHANQISFPGGKPEDIDSNLLETAIRETKEEIGIEPERLLGQLSDLYIPPSNFLVQPFVGVSLQEPSFVIQETEVAELLEIPLDHLLEKNVRQQVELNVRGKDIKVPAYVWNEQIIWGATAMILSEFIALARG